MLRVARRKRHLASTNDFEPLKFEIKIIASGDHFHLLTRDTSGLSKLKSWLEL